MSQETAEQKLLKLIETPYPSDSASGPDAVRQIAPAVRGQGFLGLAIPGAVRSFFGLGKFFSGSPFQFSFGLRDMNKALLAAGVAIFVFLLVDFLNGMNALQKKIDLAVDSSAAKNFLNIILPVRNLSDYLALVESRNIFQPVEKKAAAEKTAAQSSTQKIAAMTEKLKLVGISWLDSAQTASVMIEDQESGNTYFVHQGEKVKELTVKTIYTDQVVLTFEGEEITIRL